MMQSNGTEDGGKRTVVEEGTQFKGALSSSCPIDVRGRVEGEVETPSLTVSASGIVHGRAKVGSVRSEGELSGEFDADSVVLAGTVRDSTVIRARELEVKLSAGNGKMQVTFGDCELSVGEEPTDKRDLDASAEASRPAAVDEPKLEADSDDDDTEVEAQGGKRRRKRKGGPEDPGQSFEPGASHGS